MKSRHFTFALLLFFLVGNLKSQISKGSLILDGGATIGVLFGQGDDLFNFGLAPEFGIFVNDNLVLGGRLGLSVSSIRNSTFTGYQISPIARYYFGNISEQLKVFAIGELGFFGTSGSDFNNSGFSFLLGGGLDLFLNPNVALEGILAYQNAFQDGLDQNSFGVNFGLKFFLAKDSPRAKALNTSAIKTGNVMIGGNGAIGVSSIDGNSTFVFQVTPQLGYFFTDNFMAGGNLSIAFSSGSGSSEFAFGLAPKARYYFSTPKGHVEPFLGAGLGILYDTASDEAFLQAILEGGVDLFITPTVALELGLFYQLLNLGESNGLSNLQFVVGIQKFLGSTE